MLHRLITLMKQEIKQSVQEFEHNSSVPLKYTPDEMEHPIRELSGGQKGESASLEDELKWCKCSYSG